MKLTQIPLIASLFACSLPLIAQNNYTELKDPHPGSQTVWQSVKKAELGWGSTDIRYSRSQAVPVQKKLSLRAWRGERISAQALLITPQNLQKVTFTVSDFKSGKHTISANYVRKYFVRYVMTDEYGNNSSCGSRDKSKFDSALVADRLDPIETMSIEANTTRPLWLDIRVPSNAAPGKYTASLIVNFDGQKLSLPLTLEVVNKVLPAPKDWSFHLDLWQNPYAVARYYNVPLWSKAHFDHMRPIMKLLAEAGQKVITASIIQHPWNSQTEDPFESMIAKIKGIDGTWSYNYDVFDRWVEFMMDCGITQQIDCYTLVPWHYHFDYFDGATNSVQYIDCKPGSKEYDDLIIPFLTDFAKHLKAKGWFNKTCIAMDERPMDQLRAAHETVKRADPNYRIKGAADYYPEIEPKMYDLCVTYQHPLLDNSILEARRKAGRKLTFYTCCGPERPNTFLFSPPAEAAYMAWHAIAANFDGYLRWAYNSWTVNPNLDGRFRTWAAGDCFLTYPNASSIRMERMVEGIQDYEKIKILRPTLTKKQQDLLNATLEKFRLNNFGPNDDAATLIREARRTLIQLEK